MKFKINSKYFRWGLTAFTVITASIVFYYFMFHHSNIKTGMETITDIVMPVVLGLVMAYLLTPILNFLEDKVMIPLCNKCKIRESAKRNSIIRGIGILITAFLFVSLIYLLVAMLLSQIIPSIQNIVVNFDSYTNNFIKWLDKLLEDNPEVGEYVVRTVDKYSGDLEKWMNDFTKISPLIRTVSLSVINVLGVLWDIIIGFIISIYVMASKEKFAGQAKKIVYAVFEKDTANIVIRNFRFTHKTFIGFISGKILDSIIIGILCFIGTSILHTPYAALVSVIIGVTNVIPFFGPYLGAIPCGILVFIVDPVHPLNCVYFLLFILILQQFDGNILGPKILGSSTGLTGFWVISSITLFGGLFGVLGMIIGVPIFAVIYAAIRSLVNTSLKKKKLPYETKKYENLDYIDEEGFHESVPEKKNLKHKNIIPEKSGNTQNISTGNMDDPAKTHKEV
ncbi:MAG: AI-2E family transporter [Acetatifactor sp.]|nr:AI-2E family transporter [Acetatifactor sp.]